MKVGMVGLGKLGLPIALALTLKGHDVMGFDVDSARMSKTSFPHREQGPHGEPDILPLLQASSLHFGTLEQVVEHAEVVLVAVQTPHEEQYEGITRLPQERVDFDYSYLVSAVGEVGRQVALLGEDRVVVVISTVLPGTIRREILPLLNPHVRLCYNPFFIAMGTTIPDFLHPEFVLCGAPGGRVPHEVRALYASIHQRPLFETTIENAELIKVSYNTYISTKIAFANTVMEMCHKVPGCDVDVVVDALSLATDRLMSPRYLRGGMGDGGACHPRDNIALSWLAREVDLSYDWFAGIMTARERQTDWLAELAVAELRHRYPGEQRIGLYGRAFKAGTAISTGSPAMLLSNLLREKGVQVQMYDPYLDTSACPFDWSGVYVVTTSHPEFATPEWRFPSGSVIIDPWRYIPDHLDVHIVRVGVGAVD